MPSVNKVILVGNVGKSPEVRFTQSGDPVASFSLATSESWTDKSGQKQEQTSWHKVVVFGKTAGIVRDYVEKGKSLYIEGQMVYGGYVNKDGNKVPTAEVHLKGFNSRLVLLGSKPAATGVADPASGGSGADGAGAADDDSVPF